MRTFSQWVALAVLVGGPAAYADVNDIKLSRLGNPASDPTAQGKFEAVTRSLAASVTSANLMPPETTGHAGFSVNMELGVAGVSPDNYPSEDPGRGGAITPLLIPSIHVRKGLPFSLELGARMGWIDRSSLFATTGEVKWAVNEGFTWLPDVGVRAHVTRLLGARDLNLTAAGVDLGVGKQFPLGGMVTLTPYGGVDFVRVNANTRTLDFSSDDVVRVPGDTTDTGVYRNVSATNTRFYGGARFIGGVLQLGAELSLTTQGNIPAVLAFSGTIGLDF